MAISFTSAIIRIKDIYPKFRVVLKKDSPLMRFLGCLMFFNPDFMTRFTTTIGYTIYVVDEKALPVSTLMHEAVHMHQRTKDGFWFYLKYTFPQNLSVFSLLGLLAIPFSSWFALFFLFLVFLAPVPSITRFRYELEGYTVTMLCYYYYMGNIPDYYIEGIAGTMSGFGYYKMGSYSKALKELDHMADKIRNHEFSSFSFLKEASEVLRFTNGTK